MIKSLLEEQEETPKKEKEKKKTSSDGSFLSISSADEAKSASEESVVDEVSKPEDSTSEENGESSSDVNDFDVSKDTAEKSEDSENSLETDKEEKKDTKEDSKDDAETKADKNDIKKTSTKDLLSSSQIASNMSLALSMGVAVVGSVIFMLIIGWIADTFLGTSPYGKVVGILLGSFIGLLQLFRISARIIMPKKSDFDKVSFKANEDVVEKTETKTSSESDKTGDPDGKSETVADAVSAESVLSETEAEIETLLAGASSDEAKEIADAVALIEQQEGVQESASLMPDEEESLEAFVTESVALEGSDDDTDDGEVETVIAKKGSDVAEEIREAVADTESE